jgi:hypothetical protein
MWRTRTLIGVGLLALGNIVLLERISHGSSFDVGQLWQWAPLLLVLAGLVGLARLLDAKQAFRGPLLMTALGVVLLMITVKPVARLWMPWGWAVVALVVGWWLAVSGRSSACRKGQEDWPREICIFDTRIVINDSRAFRSGTIFAILGGCTYDLRLAEPADNDPRLDVTAMLGGVDVILPHDWQVEFQSRRVLGVCRNLIPETKPASDAPTGSSAVHSIGVPATQGLPSAASAPRRSSGQHDEEIPPPRPAPAQRRVTISALAVLGGIDVRQAP